MRPLEIVTPILLAVHVLWRAPRPAPIRFLPAIALLIVLIHFAVEGYRWQMIPLYALTVILAALATFHVEIKTAASILTLRLAQGSALLLLAISTALPILLPVPRIANPSGPYNVGTRIYELIDDSRREIYSGRDEARRFMIQVWYPSEADSSAERAPWMSEAKVYAPAIANQIGMPSFFLDHLALVKIPAYKDAKVARREKSFPVILFSHGWNGFNAQNTGQALELASQGYVVIGVQHTYGAVVTVFPNGDVALNNPAALPSDETPTDEYEVTAQKLVNQWAGDLGYTLDFLKKQNEDSSSPFYEKLDLNLVGVYGHSTGGGAAVQFCGTDPRCIALLGMDPFMRPVSYEVIDNGVTQPSFFMFSQVWADEIDSRNNTLFNRFYPNAKQPFGVISIDGTAHYDFTDLPLLTPLASQLGLKGPINGKLVTTIVNDYLLSFFDLTLKGKATDLFDPATIKYAEVKRMK
jgi:predicted dienelactone hydrolase